MMKMPLSEQGVVEMSLSQASTFSQRPKKAYQQYKEGRDESEHSQWQ
jgi:hypothetical protein